MFYALYAAQGPGRKATGFGEGALPPGSAWQWQGPGAGALAAQGDRLLAHGHIARLAQTTWHTGDTSTGSSVTLRLANLQDRLMLRRVPTMMLILSVEEEAAVAQQPGAIRRSTHCMISAVPSGRWAALWIISRWAPAMTMMMTVEIRRVVRPDALGYTAKRGFLCAA
jgi:hypothetical protein